MNPASRNPRFFKHFDPAKWEDELCADLAPVLRVLLAEPGNTIASMGLENIKAPDLTVLLSHPPSSEAFAKVEALCAGNDQLRTQADWVACLTHYSTIEWDASQPAPTVPVAKPSLFKRLFG